jgi:hypothetical protein
MTDNKFGLKMVNRSTANHALLPMTNNSDTITTTCNRCKTNLAEIFQETRPAVPKNEDNYS